MHDRDWFFSAYDGVPPWDIGRPQNVVRELAEAGEITGSVLDVGCGTGENALYLASLGYRVTGVDMVEKALEKARAKAGGRRLEARFVCCDALELGRLDSRFDTLLDCGLFHLLSDEQRPAYLASLGQVSRPGSRLFLLCFSDQEPGQLGPRRISQDEIQGSFEPAWSLERIAAVRLESNFHPEGARAWLARMERA